MKHLYGILAGLGLGLLCLVWKITFEIPDDVFWRYYLILAGVIIVGTAGINFCYNNYYNRRMKAASKLYEAGKIEEYIAEVESLRSRAKGRYAKGLLTVNLSAGYSRLKQYDKGIEVLESLSNVKLPMIFQVVYCINLCCFYFYEKQTERALELYENSQKVFKPFRNKKPYGGNIAVIDIYAAIGKQDYVRAAKLLPAVRSQWTGQEFQEDYRYFEEIIAQAQRTRMIWR